MDQIRSFEAPFEAFVQALRLQMLKPPSKAKTLRHMMGRKSRFSRGNPVFCRMEDHHAGHAVQILPTYSSPCLIPTSLESSPSHTNTMSYRHTIPSPSHLFVFPILFVAHPDSRTGVTGVIGDRPHPNSTRPGETGKIATSSSPVFHSMPRSTTSQP